MSDETIWEQHKRILGLQVFQGDPEELFPDYPDNEAEEAAYAYLELMHKHFVCGWKEHERACQRLCEVFGFDGWEHWRGTRE